MQDNKTFAKYFDQLEKFYINLAEISKSQGFLLDFFTAEALPCNKQGKPLSLTELQTIYGSDMPADWKWRYNTFLEDDEHLRNILRILAVAKGQDIAFNFATADAFLGNVAVRIEDRWFAIGECRNCSTPLPSKELGEFSQEFAVICNLKLWNPFYVLSNMNRVKVHLEFAMMVH